MRLRSDIWVAAYLRRCGVEGASAVLRRRGAAEARAPFSSRSITWTDARPSTGQAPQSVAAELGPGVERIFVRAHSGDSIGSGEAEEQLEREIAFDPDLWQPCGLKRLRPSTRLDLVS